MLGQWRLGCNPKEYTTLLTQMTMSEFFAQFFQLVIQRSTQGYRNWLANGQFEIED